MPCLLTALAELNDPRYMTPGGVFDAYKVDIPVWSEKDIPIDESNLGLKGSPTKVFKSFTKALKGQGEQVQLDPQESANYIVEKLIAKHII